MAACTTTPVRSFPEFLLDFDKRLQESIACSKSDQDRFEEFDMGKKRAILIVEDNKINRMIIKKSLLAKFGASHRIYCVKDDHNALRALLGLNFSRIDDVNKIEANFENDQVPLDCVIMDNNLATEKTGMEITEIFRRYEKEELKTPLTSQLPIIGYSGDDMKTHVKEDCFTTSFIKPAQNPDLIKYLEELIAVKA